MENTQGLLEEGDAEKAAVEKAIFEDDFIRENEGVMQCYFNCKSVYCKKTLALIAMLYINEGGNFMNLIITTKLFLRLGV